MTLRHCSPIHGFTDFQELQQSYHEMARNCEANGFMNVCLSVFFIHSFVRSSLCLSASVRVYLSTNFATMLVSHVSLFHKGTYNFKCNDASVRNFLLLNVKVCLEYRHNRCIMCHGVNNGFFRCHSTKRFYMSFVMSLRCL